MADKKPTDKERLDLLIDGCRLTPRFKGYGSTRSRIGYSIVMKLNYEPTGIPDWRKAVRVTLDAAILSSRRDRKRAKR